MSGDEFNALLVIVVLGLNVDNIGGWLDANDVLEDLIETLLPSELREEIGVMEEDLIGGGGGGDLFGLDKPWLVSSSSPLIILLFSSPQSSLNVTFNLSVPFELSREVSSSVLEDLIIFWCTFLNSAIN